MVLLSIVTSPHPYGSSGEELGIVNFSIPLKTEQHQRLLSQENVSVSYLERCLFNIGDNVIFLILNAITT